MPADRGRRGANTFAVAAGALAFCGAVSPDIEHTLNVAVGWAVLGGGGLAWAIAGLRLLRDEVALAAEIRRSWDQNGAAVAHAVNQAKVGEQQ